MRPRHDLVEVFASFLQMEGDRVQHWVLDPRLRRSMRQQLAGESSQSDRETTLEDFWAIYWHRSWQGDTHRLARDHLAAYVQEPCFWAAQKTASRFSSTQYALADCFQMAIAGLDKVLSGFNSDQGFSLKNYAGASFSSLIRESLRQRQEVDICTDWALLRKLSQKRLTRALLQAGKPQEEIDRYVLAWNAFRTLYTPGQGRGTRQLPKPDRETLENIAERYNRDRHTQLPATTPPLSPETLETWLVACARAARNYLYPQQLSLNAPRSEGDEGEFIDLIDDHRQDSLLHTLITQEEIQTRQQQRAQVSEVLAQAIQALPAELKQILDLYYHQGYTQQQMAESLNTKQYTVSRRLSKARETLLKALAKWGQETLHTAPTSDVLKYTSHVLEEWLQAHYHSQPQTSLAE
jgi:RNA polymerase sigma factor (sigma-70 family)